MQAHTHTHIRGPGDGLAPTLRTHMVPKSIPTTSLGLPSLLTILYVGQHTTPDTQSQYSQKTACCSSGLHEGEKTGVY